MAYDVFCQQLLIFLDETIAVDGTPTGVETSYFMDRVREHISHQYPNKLYQVFPREKMTANLPTHPLLHLRTSTSFPFLAEAKQSPSAQPLGNLPRPLALKPIPRAPNLAGMDTKKTPRVAVGQ